jgi:putative transposase
MIMKSFDILTHWGAQRLKAAATQMGRWTRPPTRTLGGGALADVARTKRALVAENALLRQQLIVLQRQVKRPTLTPGDRVWLVLLARLSRTWQTTLLIVQPQTLLRWHRQGYRLFWRARSAAACKRPQIAPETVALIQQMARENRLWGAERIRGELLKLGLRVGKRTVQRYIRGVRPPRRSGQTWATFLSTHAYEIWACDFLPVVDVGFRTLHAFFIVELGSRRVVHVGVTRQPTDAWVAQQLREATPFGMQPRFLIRDNDSKFGAQFARVAATTPIEILRIPFRAPRANAICERFLGSVRRDCLDHVLILSERHLLRVLRTYSTYFNGARPHQGLGQALPEPVAVVSTASSSGRGVRALPVLGGLHHDYQRVA